MRGCKNTRKYNQKNIKKCNQKICVVKITRTLKNQGFPSIKTMRHRGFEPKAP